MLLIMSMSHPTRGAWIEMSKAGKESKEAAGRTPHGVRGLKYTGRLSARLDSLSHPTRGAWIEIPCCSPCQPQLPSHPTRGAWIEIWWGPPGHGWAGCRTPHGVRGLKFTVRSFRAE